MSHKITRRHLLELGSALSLASVLASCAPMAVPEAKEEATRPPAMAEPVAQAVSIRFGCHDGVEGAREEIRKAFYDKVANITVELEHIGDFHEKVYAMAAAGTMPDVMRMWEAMVVEMGRHGQVLDLNPYIEVTPDFDHEDFFEAWWNYPLVEGMRVGVSDAVAPHVTFYNVDLFAEKGVPEPGVDSFTWDDFEEKARAITDVENRVWGSETIPVGWHYFTAKQCWQNDGDFFSPDNKECWIAKPESIEAIQYWADLLMDGGVMPSLSQIAGMGGEGVEAQLFGAGKIGMQRMGAWVTGSAVQAPFQFNITHEPSKKRRDTIDHGAFNAITARTTQRDAAWAWLNHIVSTESLYTYACSGHFPATRHSTNRIEPYSWVMPVDHDVNWDVVRDAASYGRVLPAVPNEGEALKTIGDALEKIYNGQAKAAEILPEIAPKVTRIITDI